MIRWPFFTIWSGLFFVWFTAAVPQYYLHKETSYLLPVISDDGTWSIRNDKWGDGDFGARRGGGRRKHKGVDLAAPTDSLVFNTRSGRIVHAAEKGNYGNLVIVVHWDFSQSRYAHMNK